MANKIIQFFLFFSVSTSALIAADIHEAVLKCDLAKVKYSIEQERFFIDSENALGATALHVWCEKGFEPGVRYLLSKSADANREHLVTSMKPILYAAAYTDNPAIIRMLIDSGADPEASDRSGYTAKDFADAARHEKVLKELKSKKRQ